MRPLIVLLALSVATGLAGCATPGSDDDNDPTPTPSATPTPATPTPTPTPASPTPTPASPTPTPASPTPTPATPTPPPPPVTINIQNIAQGFDPATKTIPIGTNVTWMNKDPALPHTATADDGTFDSGNLAAGTGTYSFVFNATGTFPYKCSLHPTMTATITVQ